MKYGYDLFSEESWIGGGYFEAKSDSGAKSKITQKGVPYWTTEIILRRYHGLEDEKTYRRFIRYNNACTPTWSRWYDADKPEFIPF